MLALFAITNIKAATRWPLSYKLMVYRLSTSSAFHFNCVWLLFYSSITFTRWYLWNKRYQRKTLFCYKGFAAFAFLFVQRSLTTFAAHNCTVIAWDYFFWLSLQAIRIVNWFIHPISSHLKLESKQTKNVVTLVHEQDQIFGTKCNDNRQIDHCFDFRFQRQFRFSDFCRISHSQTKSRDPTIAMESFTCFVTFLQLTFNVLWIFYVNICFPLALLTTFTLLCVSALDLDTGILRFYIDFMLKLFEVIMRLTSTNYD